MYVAFVSHASGSLGFAGRLHALCGARGIVSSCPLWDWEMNKAIIAAVGRRGRDLGAGAVYGLPQFHKLATRLFTEQ
jgi:hypothetical protein